MRLRSGYLLVLTITAALVVLSRPARASQIAYDGFSPSFPVYAGGGTGFSGPWAQGGFNAFASGYVRSESSLCFARLQLPTSGGSISGGAFSAINGALRNLQQPLGQNNTTVYLSFLLEPQGSLNDGIFNGFFGLTLNGSLAGNDVFTLYVDPSRGPEPNSGAMKTDLDLGVVSRAGIYSTGGFAVDEIRIGTRYADVVPANHGRHDDPHGCGEGLREDDK